MAYTKEQLKTDLMNLGICAGDVVLMHSSFKALGEIEGGAKTFFEGFSEVLGEEGTLILPALSWESVTRENPVFEADTTPSCVGYLTEYFRKEVPGVVRSMHATHSCCVWGKLAEELIKDHELDNTPVGNHSPFTKLPKVGGKLLMLGCGTRCITMMHGVEERTKPPYGMNRDETVTYTLKGNGKAFEIESYRHNFITEKGNVIVQRYDRVVDLLEKNEISKGKVLSAECVLMDAEAVWKKGYDKLMKEPLYFVDYPEE